MQDNQITKIPAHIAIIMDGNGRWAQARGKNRSYGHRAGSDNVDRIVTHAFERGVKAVTLYAFSCENWSRPKEEVDGIFGLVEDLCNSSLDKFNELDIKVVTMGDLTRIPNTLKNTFSLSSNPVLINIPENSPTLFPTEI